MVFALWTVQDSKPELLSLTTSRRHHVTNIQYIQFQVRYWDKGPPSTAISFGLYLWSVWYIWIEIQCTLQNSRNWLNTRRWCYISEPMLHTPSNGIATRAHCTAELTFQIEFHDWRSSAVFFTFMIHDMSICKSKIPQHHLRKHQNKNIWA